MIQPSFQLRNQIVELETPQHVSLIIEYSKSQIVFIWHKKSNATLLMLRVYPLPQSKESDPIAHLNDIFESEPIHDWQPIDVQLMYQTMEFSLLPASVYQIDMAQSLMQLVAGDAEKGLVFSEKIPGFDIYGVYRIPTETHKFFQHKIRNGIYWHFNSKWLQTLKTYGATATMMYVVIHADHISVAVLNNGEPLLVQSYSYQTPEDVSWQLLSLLRELALKPHLVKVYLTGMVEEDSSLYLELQKYFLQLSFVNYDGSTWKDEILKSTPGHYFTNYLDVALCE